MHLKALLHAFVLLSLLLVCTPAHAQVEVGPYDIIQCGKVVGMIYAPWREPGAPTYDEHWVLSPRYVYPGPSSVCVTELHASPHAYRDLNDFLTRVHWEEGFTYIHVVAHESSKLPGR